MEEEIKIYLYSFLVNLLLFLAFSFFYFDYSSSMAVSSIAICLMIIIYRMFLLHNLQNRKFINTGVFIFIFIFTHFIVASFFWDVDFYKFFYSIFFVPVMLYAGLCLSEIFIFLRPRNLDVLIYSIYYYMNIIGFIAISKFPLFRTDVLFKSIFPFTEPSHFALIYTPFLMYVCASSLKISNKVLNLIVGVTLALVIENLTLIIGCSLVAIACLPKKLVALLILIAIAFLAYIQPSYYLDRLNFSTGDMSLSSLVYVQGWELMYDSLEKTNLWGLGFQNLGLRDPGLDSSSLIYKIAGSHLNLYDGSFTLSKIVSEFGIFGIIFFIFLIKNYYISYVSLRKLLLSNNKCHYMIFAHCCILGSCLELLFRGLGYFTFTSLLLISALITSCNFKNNPS